MNISRVIGLDSKKSNTLIYTYVFLRRLILHTFNYMVVTYGYFSLWSWDKDHCTQNELAIVIMYKLLQKIKANQKKFP